MQGQKACAGTIKGMMELPERAHREPELGLSFSLHQY